MKKALLIITLLWSVFASAHNYTREEILNNPDAPAFAKLTVGGQCYRAILQYQETWVN